MALLIFKITTISVICLIILRLLRINSVNLKQKVVFFSLTLCLISSLNFLLPTFLNINKLKSISQYENNNFLVSQAKENINTTSNLSLVERGKSQVGFKEKFMIDSWNVLLVFWILGVIFHLLRYLFQVYQVKLLIRNSQKFIQPNLRDSFKNKSIDYHISDKTVVPFLFVTFYNIKIVLPQQAKYWSPLDVRNVIDHEMCHYQRKDHIFLWFTDITAINGFIFPSLNLLVKFL